MAEKNYCCIENGKIVYGPGQLPTNWKSDYMNLTNMPYLTDVELKTYGWLPFEEVHISYDAVTHYRDGYAEDIQEDKVVFTNIITPYTSQELKTNKWNTWMTDMFVSDKRSGDIGVTRNDEWVMERLLNKFPDIMDHDPDVKGRYDRKKTLRATRPEKPE